MKYDFLRLGGAFFRNDPSRQNLLSPHALAVSGGRESLIFFQATHKISLTPPSQNSEYAPASVGGYTHIVDKFIIGIYNIGMILKSC